MFKTLSFFILITFLTQGVIITAAGAEDASSEVSKPEVIFETTKGSFTLELYPEKAPKHVANFLRYVDEGFYDNTIFHRVIPGFVIQGGGFENEMKYKKPGAPIKNESSNRLTNLRGTISMARRTHPDTATSQFYINLSYNESLDYKGKYQPGYTVFGKISKGMDVIDEISAVPTTTVGRSRDVPMEDVVVLSAKQKGGKVELAPKKNQEQFTAGEHYIVLDKPLATRDSSKIEVVEMFSYGCPHCYEFEPLVKEWGKQQSSDIDFWYFPAVWRKSMKLYAGAFYAAHQLNVADEVHVPLFTAIVIDQKSIRNESDLANYFAKHGVDKKAFTEAFNSTAVENQVKQAEARTRSYKPVGVPEIIINGKYRIDRMRAGGLAEMIAVADFLINKERAMLNK